jgi:hypothetical protein
VRLALVDKSGSIISDSAQEIEIFPKLQPLTGRRAFIIGGPAGIAATLAKELGLKTISKGKPKATDVILIDDLELLAGHQPSIESFVRAGGTAVLLELPAGRHSILGDTVNVVPGGMGPPHFADCSTNNELVANFEPYDFWFWHDDQAGYPTPLLNSVLESEPVGWTTVIKSGNGSWSDDWKPVPAVVEKVLGEGVIRICQVKLANRTKTNPTAALFARGLMSLDNNLLAAPRNGSLNGSAIKSHLPAPMPEAPVLQAKSLKSLNQIQARKT